MTERVDKLCTNMGLSEWCDGDKMWVVKDQMTQMARNGHVQMLINGNSMQVKHIRSLTNYILMHTDE